MGLMIIERDIIQKALQYIDTDEILIFTGSRQAGKTTVLKMIEAEAKKKEATTYFLNLEDPEYLGLLNDSPKSIFKIFTIDGKKRCFLFVDEVQYLRNPTNFLKYIYDEYKGIIKLVVSGSSAFYLDEKFKDSLAGRKRIFHVRTLSFREFLRFKGEKDLFAADFKNVGLKDRENILTYYREFMIYGGYPRVVLAPLEEKEKLLQELAYSYVKKDIYEAGVRQDEVFYKLFKILASQVGNLVNSSELASTLGVSKTAIDRYIFVMRRSFHVEMIRPFYRSARKELTKMPKVYFWDLGLRNFFVGDFKSFDGRSDRGALLENAVFRALCEKYEEDSIKFWRTTQKHEVDFVAAGKDAFEVKTASGKLNKRSIELFREHYPYIPVSLITFDTEDERNEKYPAVEAWQM